MRYIIFIILFFITACTTVMPPQPFLEEMEQPDIDCKYKSVSGHRLCEENNINSHVVCGVISSGYEPMLHCWLEVYYLDGWKLVDLLEWTVDGWPVEQYTEYHPYIRFSNDIYVSDIIQRKNYTWKREGSLQDLIDSCDFYREPTRYESIVGNR